MNPTFAKFLIVDDNPTFTSVLTRALQRRGFDTQIAHSNAEAISVAREQQFDRAIIDLKIAQDSGLELIGTLIQIQPQLQMIMLTGYSSIATAVEAVKLGAINYLCKPANTDEILAAFGEQTAAAPIPATPPSVNRLEWEHIQRVLQEYNGNVSATARALGMHRRTLQRKLQKRPVKQ